MADGRAGVTVGTPSWSNSAGSDDNNTFTVAASNGASTSLKLLITPETISWSSAHKATIYVRSSTTGGAIRLRKTIDATSVYNAGITEGESHFTAVSNARSNLTYYGYYALYRKEGDTYTSAGLRHWFYSTGSAFETLYKKTT